MPRFKNSWVHSIILLVFRVKLFVGGTGMNLSMEKLGPASDDNRLPWSPPRLKKGVIGVETGNLSGTFFDGGALNKLTSA